LLLLCEVLLLAPNAGDFDERREFDLLNVQMRLDQEWRDAEPEVRPPNDGDAPD
jgi:hypothetical protein